MKNHPPLIPEPFVTERILTPSKRLTKAQERMRDIVASLQKYMATYDKQWGYLDYQDKTFIDDVLYGLGRAMGKEYEFSGGFDKFKDFLRAHLSASSERTPQEIGRDIKAALERSPDKNGPELEAEFAEWMRGKELYGYAAGLEAWKESRRRCLTASSAMNAPAFERAARVCIEDAMYEDNEALAMRNAGREAAMLRAVSRAQHARELAAAIRSLAATDGCPLCGYDCAGANPPIAACPMASTDGKAE